MLFCSDACLGELQPNSRAFSGVKNICRRGVDRETLYDAQYNEYISSWWTQRYLARREELAAVANPNRFPSELEAAITDGSLAPEAKQIWDLFVNNKNFAVTGPAGVGKSATLRTIIPHLLKTPLFSTQPGSLAVVAATNTASVNFGPSAEGTLHSFLGVGFLE